MQISYDYYIVFYYVAKYKSFTAAAKALLSNQPNVTRTIKNLENSVGCTLFIRSNQGVTLTPEGEKLYGYISAAFKQIDAAERELSLEKTLQRGIVSIAVTEVALHCLLIPILKKYRLMYPGVKINITNQSTPQATNYVKNGLADFAVVTSPTVKSASLKEIKIKDIKEAAVCGGMYKELINRRVKLEQLKEYPIISLDSHSNTYDRYSQFFSKHNIVFSPEIEIATTDQIIPLVKSDLGIGFVPLDMIKDQNDIYVIDLEEKIPERHIYLVKRKDISLSIAAKELEKLIVNYI